MTTFSTGREQLLWVKAESTFGSYGGDASTDPFLAADGVQVKTATCDSTTNKEVRDDKDNTNSANLIVDLRKEGTFTINGYLLGAGTASGTPDFDPIFAAAFGSGVGTGSSYQYKLTTDPTSSFAMLLDNATTRNHQKIGVGCVPDTLTWAGEGAGKVTWEATGPLKDVYECVRVTCSGAQTASDLSINVEDSQGVTAMSILSVGSQGAERLQVASNTADILTVDRGFGAVASGAIASGDILLPWSPSTQSVTSVNVIPGTLGSLTIDSASFDVKSWSVTLGKNVDYHNDSYGQDSADGFATPNKREITLECTFRLERDLIPKVIGAAKNNTIHAITLVAGTATGNTHTWVMARCKMMAMPTIEYPEREIVDVTATWKATHTTANSEMTYTIT